MDNDELKIVETDEKSILVHGICGYKSIKRAGFPEKVDWVKKRKEDGLRIKSLYSEQAGTQGMIEYLPGKNCWRPVEAGGYMFIHCLFTGFKKIYKNRGYGSLLLNECIKDAKSEGMAGVAVVTRKGAFMAGKELFLKNGFEIADKMEPDFELLVLKFDKEAVSPRFKKDQDERLRPYEKGLTIIRAYQCPYTVKNVNEISRISEEKYGIKTDVITLETAEEAQNNPCPFGTFCIIYNGKIIAEHPISGGRFTNIMEKILN